MMIHRCSKDTKTAHLFLTGSKANSNNEMHFGGVPDVNSKCIGGYAVVNSNKHMH
jgi:hypothetical protein